MTRFWGPKASEGGAQGEPHSYVLVAAPSAVFELGSVTSCWTDPDLAVCWWEGVNERAWELLCVLCSADQHSMMAAPRLICVTLCACQCPGWHLPSEIQWNTADEKDTAAGLR